MAYIVHLVLLLMPVLANDIEKLMAEHQNWRLFNLSYNSARLCCRGSSASAPAVRNEYDDGTTFFLYCVFVAVVCVLHLFALVFFGILLLFYPRIECYLCHVYYM